MLAPQSVRVSGAVLIFVMQADNAEIRLEGADAFEDAYPNPGMHFDHAELVVG